jgi:hypothetical protein
MEINDERRIAKIKKSIIICIACIGGIVSLRSLYYAITATPYMIVYEPKAVYNDLFDSSKLRAMRLILNHESDIKSTISEYLLDSSYYVFVYRINVADSVPLIHLIKEDECGSVGSLHDFYPSRDGGFREDNFDLVNSFDSFSRAKEIHLIFDGEILAKKSKGDSILYYNFTLHRLDFKYSFSGYSDLALKKRTESQLRANILFLKRRDYVYLLIMCPENNGISLEENMVVDLLKI